MKLRRLLMMCVLVVLALSIVVVPVSAKENKGYFSGKECEIDSPPNTPPPTIRPLSDGRELWTDLISYNTVTSNNPRISGSLVFRLNFIVDWASGNGPTWGKIVLTNGSGGWSGLYVGELEGFGWTMHAILLGTGAFKGLVAKMEITGWNDGTLVHNCFDIAGNVMNKGDEQGSDRR
jgi:hypothetical protein